MRCPNCDQISYAASAWSSGENPGWICSHCGEFVSDDENAAEESAPDDAKVADAWRQFAEDMAAEGAEGPAAPAPAITEKWETDDAKRDSLRLRAVLEYQRIEAERIRAREDAQHKAELRIMAALIKNAEEHLGITGGRPYWDEEQRTYTESVPIRRPTLEHDGLKIIHHGGSAHRFRLAIKCPKCHAPTETEGFSNLYDLGELLAGACSDGPADFFHPDPYHRCRCAAEQKLATPQAPTTAEQLLTLLARFVSENTPTSLDHGD